jgi:hypothetical protein
LQNKINLRYCASGWFYYRNTVGLLYCNGKNIDPEFALTVIYIYIYIYMIVYILLIEISLLHFLVAVVIMLKDPLFLPPSSTVYYNSPRPIR